MYDQVPADTSHIYHLARFKGQTKQANYASILLMPVTAEVRLFLISQGQKCFKQIIPHHRRVMFPDSLTDKHLICLCNTFEQAGNY